MKKGCFRKIIVVLLLAALLIVASPWLWETAKKMIYPREYTVVVEANAAEYRLEENLVYAVIWAESKFKEDAESPAGAMGLMQLTQETYDWVSTHEGMVMPENGDIWTPENNIRAGCGLLRFLLNHYGSLEVALSAYNAGMGNVSGWLQDEKYSSDGKTLDTIPFPETDQYVKKVLQTYEIYRQIYASTAADM